MKAIVSPGDMIFTKFRLFFYKEEYTWGNVAHIDKNSLLFIVAVRQSVKQHQMLNLCVMCSNTGKIGWIHCYISDINDYISILVPAP